MNKPFIWRHTVYTWHTPTQNFLGNFGICHVTVWTWNKPSLYLVYTRYILWPYRNVTCTEISQKVLSRCMPGIYCMSSYERFIHVLYLVYTRYIPGIYYLSMVNIRFMLGIYSIFMFTWNLSFQWCHILGICSVYTINISWYGICSF